MIRYIILSGLVLLFSCKTTVRQPEDTSIKDNVVASNDEPFLDNSSYEQMKKQYQSKYAVKQKIDTVFDYKGQQILLSLEHLCAYDTIVIPAKYSWSSTSQEDFITHNFQSRLVLIAAKDTIVKMLIGKSMFESLLDESLMNYGVLLYPSFEGFNQEQETVQIHYSISIPLTDVGKGVALNVGLDGATSSID